VTLFRIRGKANGGVRFSPWKTANMNKQRTAAIAGTGYSDLERRGLRTVYTRDGGRHTPPLLPEIVMLGWSCFPRAQVSGLGPHSHEAAFEICYIVEGRVDWWIGESVYPVGRGDIFVTRPDEPHGGADAIMHPCELYWLQIAFPDHGALPGLSEERCFPATTETSALFDALMDEHRNPEAPFASVAARAVLHRLLTQIARDYTAHLARPKRETLSPPIDRAVSLMSERLGEPLNIETIAATVGMSLPRFSERFHTETGLPPNEWRVRRRIEEARRLLTAPDATVTEVAHTLGFASSQYFATAFKKYTGRTPTDYRRSSVDG
jgi:AraC-like DNA-binding protein/quercetin dioxygenase-like cupin family protein